MGAYDQSQRWNPRHTSGFSEPNDRAAGRLIEGSRVAERATLTPPQGLLGGGYVAPHAETNTVVLTQAPESWALGHVYS
jgi:hypothetical protein